MLCGLPFPSFSKTVKRERPIISAPIQQGSERMNTWRNADTGNKTSDSGVFYLVPNPNATGKHLVKRPRTPQTSAPLDDDFDAATQTHFGTFSKAGNPSRGYRPPPLRVIPPSPKQRPGIPSVDTFFGGANKTTSPIRPSPNQSAGDRLGPQTQGQHGNGAASPNSSRSKGKARQELSPTGEYAEYQTYMQEMEKIFGGHGDLDISVNRMKDRSGTRESLTIGRVKSTGKPKRPHGGSSPPFIVSKTLMPPGKVAKASYNDSKLLRPRQDFEETSRRVIESTPDKTVTISTWREQVAQETEDDDAVERMSIYYVSGDVDLDMLEHAKGELDDLGGDTGVTRPRNPERSVDTPPTSPFNKSTAKVPSTEARSIAREASVKTEVRHSELPAPSRAAPSWIRPSQYLPNPVIPQNSSLTYSSSTSSSSRRTSTSSIRSPQQFPPTPPPKPTKLPRLKIGPQQSTPVDTRVDISSFHPTRDGSMISSIKSSGSSDSISGLVRVLGSCRPPLTHLTPTLGKLGITTKEHLQALADLDPDTRDRELREEALKHGVTNMEWAILVNRLKTL